MVRRVAVLWAIEVGALWAMARVLPGLSLEGWGAAVLGVAVIGLLNALVRPILLYLTLPFTVLSFGLLTLAINAVIVSLASMAVPGLHVTNFASGMVVALGLSVVNTVSASLLAFNDEDSVYRNITRRVARRSHPMPADAPPGLVFIELDGLSFETLTRAVREGYLPTLASWLHRGTHRALRWDCGVPCGDVVVNGRHRPIVNEVESFEEMVGAHGGLGGAQTHGFLLHPSAWAVPSEEITNAEDLYQLFVRWRDALAGGDDPAGTRVDALRSMPYS